MRFVVDKNCDRYFSHYFIFPLSVSVYCCTILIFLTPNRYIILAIEASLNDTCNTLRHQTQPLCHTVSSQAHVSETEHLGGYWLGDTTECSVIRSSLTQNVYIHNVVHQLVLHRFHVSHCTSKDGWT